MRGNPVRKTILYGSAGALVVAIVSLVLVFAAMQTRTGWPADGCGSLLWVIDGAATGDEGVRALGILSLHPAGIALVFVPEDLSVKRRDGRLVELSELGESEGWSSCCDALDSLLGVHLAGHAVLSAREAVALMEQIEPIRETGQRELSSAKTWTSTVGKSAEALGEGRDSAARALLAAVGSATDEGASAARRLLSRARTSIDLGAVWDALRRAAQSGDPMEVGELPSSVMVRDGIARRVVKVVEAERLVWRTIRAQEPLTADDISVAIFNGSGARLAATRAALYLQDRGFRVARIGNADDFEYAATYIVRLTEDAKAWILRDALPGVAKIVGAGEFGSHYEALSAEIPRGTDAVLVVGAGMEFTR